MFATIAAIFGVFNLLCLVLDLLCCAVGLRIMPFDSGHLS